MTLQQLRYVTAVADAGSMNEAAKALYISQPSLSGAVKELENEVGIEIFKRTNKGVQLTPEGEEFLGYARQLMEQYQLIEDRFIRRTRVKSKFSVSMQHYTFAVKAFVELVKQYGMDEYEFAVYETKTSEVISDVRNFKSELGILFQNEFNRKALTKILKDNNLEFHELFSCGTYVYLWKNHPLAGRSVIDMEELKEYPCLMFDQGSDNSFFLAEEVMSTYEYKRVIRANDRATMLNLMVGLNGYTLCSGIICEELNGSEYTAVWLNQDERMSIGYIQRRGMMLSPLAVRYLEEIRRYENYILKGNKCL
ncbi:MAG: LysR family transcriptional regulator [Lachnospiraceae bacterium]|nr:LysR family transcriptional regulator [Lachnospiraceae bacterium]